MATLQQQVQQHLQNTGISLRELSRQAGVSHNVVSRVLQGKRVRPINHNKLSRTVAIARKTLDATVEQLAAQCIDSDLTHVRDDALECGKQRRIAALEAEVSVVREQRNKLGLACEELTADLETEKRNFAALERVHEHVAGNLKSCENALIEAHEKITKQHAWIEHLQKQLDHGQAVYSKLCSQLGATRAKYETQLEAANQKESRLQEQLTDVYAEKTRQEAQVMRLRVYVWSLIAALALVVVSGLVVWGGV